MAIYHFSAKVIARSSGRTALGAAAYRSGERLEQDGIGGITHDYTRKDGVAFTEILAPDDAPDWARDRQALWNLVDQGEQRKDGQLARELELALPVELSKREQIELVRDFAKSELVSRGMIIDYAIHHDNPQNPHAHLMLTMRRIGPDGFGDKAREWNEKSLLRDWREAWAAATNEHLAMAGREERVDHRSHFERGLNLEPGRKIGIGQDRQQAAVLPKYLAERVAEQLRIARENGERIMGDPTIALRDITFHRATFSLRDVAKYLHTRTADPEQFELAVTTVMASAQLVRLTESDQSDARFTTREMIYVERQLFEQAVVMKSRISHVVSDRHKQAALSNSDLSVEQQLAFTHVLDRGGFSAVVGVAGSGKSTFLAAAREAWEAQGYQVRGASLSGIAADNLQRASGIPSRTIASLELAWKNERELLGPKDVLVIDEAAMVGTRQLARVVNLAHQARAKIVVVGDPEQLQAIEAGSPFRGILSQIGAAELTETRRQKDLWQRQATKLLAEGSTQKALDAFEFRNLIRGHSDDADAKSAVLGAWAKAQEGEPNRTQLMMAYTRQDVRELNDAARALRKQRGELTEGSVIATSRGQREFSIGDRLYFLRNDRELDVKNGTLGSVVGVNDGILSVHVDGTDSRHVMVDSRFYQHIDHGYAATIHKSQGTTVDRAFVLASPHMDRHATYVSLSRHRESVEMHYSTESFASRNRLYEVLSRARPKELAMDFMDYGPTQPDQEILMPTKRRDLNLLTRFQQQVRDALAKQSNSRLPNIETPNHMGDVTSRDMSKSRGDGKDQSVGLEIER